MLLKPIFSSFFFKTKKSFCFSFLEHFFSTHQNCFKTLKPIDRGIRGNKTKTGLSGDVDVVVLKL
jgi:hypothetical protein